MGGKGGSGMRNRFSDEQIKSLEVMFGSESKPEKRTKQQLASDLGLHPRQVAIWFQNKRARFKSKNIEREYGMLKASYDLLASKFECLNKENQALAAQRLTGQQGQDEECTVDGDTKTDSYLRGLKDKHTNILECRGNEMDDKALVDACLRNPIWLKREDDTLPLTEPVDSPLNSSENSWNSSCFLDQKSGNSLMWEFWS